MAGLTGWHFLIIALIILLLFGATRLPALAKGVGQSMKVFKNEMKTDENGKKIPADAEASTASTDAAQSDSAESKPKS
ncbi:MAG TPA: twin-arginine translocase TatA/TatE family subunit [Lacisediminihabitans sp.]|nr:twin-arginine translocase TatA/TatE family subunit [Lacisediminihabitans sp.]HXD62708.1 twin-arginine translocase TatA/TatE family subunit [Lacisediminihabitans sp.]